VPERVLWLGGQTQARLATRPATVDPSCNTAVRDECTLARRWLARVQDRAAATRNVVRALADGRRVLTEAIRVARLGTDLMPEAYSGGAVAFPAARTDDPPCMTRLGELVKVSQAHRGQDDDIVTQCGIEMQKVRPTLARSRVDCAAALDWAEALQPSQFVILC
jgi:hypothetical protein